MEELNSFLSWKVESFENLDKRVLEYKERIIFCIQSFSMYLHDQQVEFANKYISDILSIQQKEIVCDLISFYFQSCYLYGSIAAKRTMLLTMIALKTQIPDQINSALRDEMYQLNEESNTPKEKELLLQLFISFLSPSTVLKQICQQSPTSVSYINSLCYLPLHDLLEKYIFVSNGLLSNREDVILQATLHLIQSIAIKCDAFQCRQLISTLFISLQNNLKGCKDLLAVLCSLLSLTDYLLSPSEVQFLYVVNRQADVQESVQAVLYRGILRTIQDVQWVREHFVGVDGSRLRWAGAVAVQSCVCLKMKSK